MKYLKILSLLFITSFIFNACVDQEFDEPIVSATGEDPVIDQEKIKSMKEIKTLSGNGSIVEITEDWYIQGIVVSEDKAGNIYKVLYLQDELEQGGIQISIDGTELHASFPLYRRVFVKLQGLFVGKSNGSWAIGIDPAGEDYVGRIPQALIENYLLAGQYNVPFTPQVLRLDELNEDLHSNTLIRLEDMEMASNAINSTYADAVGKIGRSLDIVDCDENDIVLRTSGYADFAGDLVPTGNGTITGIYSIYETFEVTEQILLNSTNDIDFEGKRCNDTSTGTEEAIDIISLRELFQTGGVSAPDNSKIVGTVISDEENGNAPHFQNIIIQDGTGGVEIRFVAEHSFKMNDQVEVIVSGSEISEYKGSLQVNNVNLGSAKLTGNSPLTPRSATIDDIINNAGQWQSTLVKIENVTVESGNFAGNKMMTDASGSIILRTSDFASFATEGIPSGEVTVVGIVSNFEGTDQIKMRNREDLTGGGVVVGDIFKDDFESGGLSKWTSYSVVGDQVWGTAEFGNPGVCAKMTGYDGAPFENDDWLISKAIDLSAVSTATLNFENAKNYTGNDMELYLSSDYSGSGDPAAATWTSVTYTKSGGDWDWTASGDIDLTSYAGGNVFVGFRFTCTSSESSTWELDNIVVK